MALLVWRWDLPKLADVEAYDIVEVSDDFIRLESVSQRIGEVMLRRVPE